MVRCLRCREPLPDEAGRGGVECRLTQCARCGAPLRIDRVALDVIPHRLASDALGVRAMQSWWFARVYDTYWRPLAFGLSTRFTAPRASEEARLVIERIALCPGPWLDLSCGTGVVTRA